MHTPAILTQQWNKNLLWEFFVAGALPAGAQCTAVYCLAIFEPTGQIVLTHVPRGWEMLGGHIDPGETAEQALAREALEEGGFRIARFAQFGYGRVTATELEPNDHHGGTYPRIGYVPYFVATSEQPPTEPTGEEVLERRMFDPSDIAATGTNHSDIIRLGLQAYHANTLRWRTA